MTIFPIDNPAAKSAIVESLSRPISDLKLERVNSTDRTAGSVKGGHGHFVVAGRSAPYTDSVAPSGWLGHAGGASRGSVRLAVASEASGIRTDPNTSGLMGFLEKASDSVIKLARKLAGSLRGGDIRPVLANQTSMCEQVQMPVPAPSNLAARYGYEQVDSFDRYRRLELLEIFSEIEYIALCKFFFSDADKQLSKLNSLSKSDEKQIRYILSSLYSGALEVGLLSLANIMNEIYVDRTTFEQDCKYLKLRLDLARTSLPIY